MKHFCVLDFEATCIENKVLNNQEIIQFPSCLYKFDEITRKLTKLGEFNEFVRPEKHPILFDFCKKLTGICQETVDSADIFRNVYKRHYKWLQEHDSLENLIFITVGDWDLRVMLPNQLSILGMKPKKEYTKWINIKSSFREFYRCNPTGLGNMLEFFKLKFIGRPHNGFDDTVNTARIFERMIADGYTFTLEYQKML